MLLTSVLENAKALNVRSLWDRGRSRCGDQAHLNRSTVYGKTSDLTKALRPCWLDAPPAVGFPLAR